MIIKYNAEQLQSIFLHAIDNNIRYAGAERAEEIAKFAHCVMTGELTDEMIVSFKCGETDEQKKQRIRLNIPRTKFVLRKVQAPLKELERCDDVTDPIEYIAPDDADPTAGEMEERLKSRINTFEGDGVSAYLHEALRRLNAYDPNAWILIESKKTPAGQDFQHAVEVYSNQVINFERDFGELQYFMYVSPFTYAGQTKPVKRFLMYGHNYIFEAIERTGKDQFLTDDYTLIKLPKSGKDYYFRIWETDMGIVPAICAGYKKDDSKTSMWQTKVPFWWDAEHVIKSLIQTRAEECLAVALHGIIQKLAIVTRCKHEEMIEGEKWRCDEGKLCCVNTKQFKQCGKCKGGGLNIHTTTQDIIAIEMPDDVKEMVPIRDMVHFVEYPAGAIDHIKEARKEDEADAMRAVYCSNYFDKSEVQTQTATEIRDKKTGVNNVFGEYGANYSSAFKHIVRSIAAYNRQSNGLVVNHKFPADFKIEGVMELISQRERAVAAGVPKQIIRAIDASIIAKKHQDDPTQVSRMNVQESWKPFQSKEQTERMALFSELDDSSPLKTLYCYFDMIFAEVWEREPNFANIQSRAAQWEILLPIIREFQLLNEPAPIEDVPVQITENA